MEEERWKTIREFDKYEVSTYGRVRRIANGRVLKPVTNQYGVHYVGLMQDGRQRQRVVARLVAFAFLPHPLGPFNTPINKDGNRGNNRIDNLLWRPLWFATLYNRQFRIPYENPINAPIEDIKTGEVSQGSWDAATRYGLLEKDIVLSILNRTVTWPTYQEFRIVE